MSKILTEGFDYHDLVNQLDPIVEVDKYSAKMGSDDDIITLNFIVKGQQASEDLVDWFERGYDWVLDSQVSDGEITKGKYLVFVETKRRTSVPGKIIEMITDLETLTDLPLDKWKIVVDDVEYGPDEEKLKSVIILSPHLYRKDEETEMNEMRERAGIEPHKIFKEQDQLLKDFIAKAGL